MSNVQNLHGFYLFSTQFKVVIERLRELETQTDVIEVRPLTYFIGMGEKHMLGYKYTKRVVDGKWEVRYSIAKTELP